MKRTIGAVLMVLTLLLSIGVAPAMADTPAGATVQTLYAGQDMPVGSVTVWNDTEYLYVDYVVDAEDWVMFETHLEVVCDPADFPVNKSGNPQVGHFTYGETLNPPATEWSQVIDLDAICGTSLFIAAHAVVVRPLEDCKETVWQIGDEELVVDGQLTCYYDELNYAGDVGDEGYPQFPWFADPFVIGSSVNSDFPWLSYGTGKYASDFSVEWIGGLPFGGTVTLSWSPGRSGSEKKIATADTGETDTWTVLGAAVPVGPDSWKTYPRVENVLDLAVVEEGTHCLRFQHITGDGTFWDWVRLEKPCEQWETAWADGTLFVTQGNWATWFNYDLEPVLVETVVIPANQSAGVSSVNVLKVDTQYLFAASGQWQDTSQAGHWNDAEWATFDSWATWMQGTPNWGPNQKDLQVNLEFVDWGDYSPLHEYELSFTGAGSAVSFRVFDGQANAEPPVIGPSTWYADNVGSLTVSIYWLP
ncbi:MAG: hypothetical protein JXA58_05320 [Dehalococcoidia bacterium]|nr:hypothetical protein [Dehalococcoidia bacterium]